MTEGKVKVLIADDSKLTRISLKTTLDHAQELLEFVGEAEEGREAIEMAIRLQPDVVLMDIGMPILDGIKATHLLRQQVPHASVVMLTSHESEADIIEAFRSGATSYCLKDTSPPTLVQAILATARGDSWIDPKIAKVVLKTLYLPGSIETSPTTDEASTLSSLTEREADVLKLITNGLNNAEIAEKLCISLNTVKTHLKNIFQKLEVEDRTAAALKALKERII